ncbi:RagB/SusD family nutrient uptake outer membrane protein [Bacteroides ovatus]|uniref:RagB/SusD family nutrient uptake outer membrane protein n=1 Tax=Bacteroides ovatus TaxID=28116 RepID=UPI003144F97C
MMGKVCSWCVVLLCFLASCSEEEKSGEVFTPADYTVKGKVEKGPFIKGSTITLQPLDSKMNPLGTSYPGTILDDDGSFDMGSLKLDAPYALLTTNGYFYNEVYGDLSNGTITLQAIVDLRDNSTVNVNLLTHLAKERVKRLIGNGSSFGDANKLAQKELLTNFGLQKYAAKDVAQFSITSGTDEAAALLVVSAAMINTRSEAELTEYLGKLSLDFTANGKFTDEQITEYRKTATGLDFSRIADNVKERYKKLGKEVSVKNLAYYVDYDGNGIAGDELGDPDVPMELAFEQTELEVPKQGGTYKIKIRANVPYSFTNPLGGENVDSWESTSIFKVTPVVYEKQLNEQTKELTIKVEAAGSMLMKSEVINLYSLDGKIQSTLTICQKSDFAKTEDVLSEDGLEHFRSILLQMGEVVSYLHSIEGLYTKTYKYSSGTGSWAMLQQSPVSSSNEELEITWEKFYALIRNVCTVDKVLKEIDMEGDLSFFLSYTASIRAALYYEMAVLWENMPYIDRVLSYDEGAKITNSTLSSTFEKAGSLLNDRSFFADKKNDFSSISSMVFVSKDVPAALQAKMYLYRGEYAQALQLFEEIINSGYYQLESSRSAALSKGSKEMVYGLPLSLIGGTSGFPTLSVLGLNDEFMPLITYTEVLLSAAECAKRINSDPKANSYLNEVLAKKALTPSGDFAKDLKNVWEKELKGTGTYFAFLKRNDMAVSELGLDGKRCLILPIPYREIVLSSNLIQNPGY